MTTLAVVLFREDSGETSGERPEPCRIYANPIQLSRRRMDGTWCTGVRGCALLGADRVSSRTPLGGELLRRSHMFF